MMGLFSSRAMNYALCLCIFNLILSACEPQESMDKGQGSFRHMQIVDHNSLETLKNLETLSVVFFSHSAEISPKDSFLRAFDNSAKYLEAYSIALAVFSCIANKSPLDECKEDNEGKNIVTYQNGVELLRLEPDTMFDINSIMSNSLQLLLLHEVPIVESQVDRETLQTSLAGKQDLIFFYTEAIGTLEHRVFMEIAYTYQERYNFAISTKMEAIMGLQDSESLPSNTKFALWTMYCSKSGTEDTDDNICRNVLYRGGLTLFDLANFMERLSQPNLFYSPEDGTVSLFELESDLPLIYVYSNDDMAKHADDISTSLAYDVKGFAKIIVVNVDNLECQMLAKKQGFDGHIPHVGVVIPKGKLTFMKKRDELELSTIRHFLTTVATIPTKPGEEVVNATDLSEIGEEEDVLQEVEVQDDEVAKAVFSKRQYKTEIVHLPAVLKATFDDLVQKAQLRMVLYYLPYDAVSLTFLSDFENAAKILSSMPTTKDVLARVNCFDASDLCARENITTYPVVRIHKKDKSYQSYEGPLDSDSVIKAVGLLKQGFPQILENEDQLNMFMAGDFPTKITDLSPSSVLFVAGKEEKEAWKVFRTASKRLSTFVAMAEAHGNLANLVAKKYQSFVPCVVSVHHSDPIQPIRTLTNISGVDRVVGFVKQSMIPTMPELTVANFPVLRAKNLPFVILFLNQSSPTYKEMKSVIASIGSMDNFKDSIFCWMDVQNETLGMKLLYEYTQTASLPSIAVVNHEQAKVFTSHVETVSSEPIIDWLTSVFSGHEEPSKTLEEREWSSPGPYYDFLTLIDIEEEQDHGDKLFDSELNTGLEKEEEVREKLFEKHRSHQNVISASEDSDGQSAEAEQQDETGAAHDPTEL